MSNLPPPAEPMRFVCNKCGSVGLGSGATHQRRDGEQCAYMGVSYGPFWSADQIAAQAEELERCKRLLFKSDERNDEQAAQVAALRAEFLRCLGECMTERAWHEMRSDPKHFINVAFGGYPFDAARAALKEQTPNAELSGPRAGMAKRGEL